MTLPVLALLLSLVLGVGVVVRDLLVLQEAARVGARVASVTPDREAAVRAARAAAPELDDVHVMVLPATRVPGDPVWVETRTTRSIGPIQYPLRARSTARTEPGMSGIPEDGPWRRTPDPWSSRW